MLPSNLSVSKISLGSEFDAVVRHGGTTVELKAGGDVVVKTNGNAVVYTNGDVKVRPAANDDAKARAALQVGDPDDGGVYVGLSAEDGKPLHAALADEREYKTYGGALEAAEKLKSLHPSAHVPTPNELDQNLFANRNTGHLKGTFNTSGSFPAGVYRSSASYYDDIARVQYFDDGDQSNDDGRDGRLPVRLVW
jgi:hypothetical protein